MTSTEPDPTLNETADIQVDGLAEGGPAKSARRGRPRGPARVAITVRIRTDLDDALTAAINETGFGLQEIVEQALASWLSENRKHLLDGPRR